MVDCDKRLPCGSDESDIADWLTGNIDPWTHPPDSQTEWWARGTIIFGIWNK